MCFLKLLEFKWTKLLSIMLVIEPRAASQPARAGWGGQGRGERMVKTVLFRAPRRNIFHAMPFLCRVIESVFNFKERLWHRTLINEILACFSMNVPHYLYLPLTEMSA